MAKKSNAIRCFFYIKSIVFCLLIATSQVNAETKIIAKNGDTLIKLSKQYGIPLKELMHKNNFNDANRILEGKAIIIPQNNNMNNNMNNTYKVKDTELIFMEQYDLEVIDKYAFGLIRTYGQLCPNFSISKTSEVIAKYLDEIYDASIEVESTDIFLQANK